MSESLMDKFDRMPKLRQFDAFPKAQPMYQKRTSQGGMMTLVVFIATFLMIWYEVQHYLRIEPEYSFDVDSHIDHFMQINLDIAVNTPCSRVSVDLRDASGDIIHFAEDDLVKDPTDFRHEIDRAHERSFTQYFLKLLHSQLRSFTRKQRTNKNLVKGGPRHKDSGFYQSPHKYGDDASACRVYGSVNVKKVTGNLHITTFVPAFLAMRGHEHEFGIDMSHVIHEFSFGDYFPDIAEPLDASLELTDVPGAAFQYFMSVVPTHYVHGRHEVYTNQYSVNDYRRNPEGAAAFPGLYFKYDIEPLTMTVKKQSTSLIAFIVHLCSVLGGLWICTDLGLRVLARLMPLIRPPTDCIVSDSGMTEPMTPSQFSTPYFSGPMDPTPDAYGAYGTTSTANYMMHAPGETKYRATSY